MKQMIVKDVNELLVETGMQPEQGLDAWSHILDVVHNKIQTSNLTFEAVCDAAKKGQHKINLPKNGLVGYQPQRYPNSSFFCNLVS